MICVLAEDLKKEIISSFVSIGNNLDYGSSPRASYQQTSTVSSSSPTSRESNRPEPLLSLLTSTHPLISSAIHSSMSAYTSSKSYSPRFKYGAEFIERNIGSPVANTVGTVGRKTGVESGLRWALQRRESASAENSRSKRRKMDEKASSRDVDVERGLQNPVSSYRIRSSSSASATESLPPYDDQSSPKYEEVNQQSITPSCNQRQIPPTWQSRLMISTSGLGVAMSEESLRSLQYCLTWLRWANGRLGNAIVALQSTLKEWEEYKQQNPNDSGATASTGTDGSSKILLSQRIQAVREDVLATLKRVVDVVSKYAGGALPENARNLVRRHLTSLPQRFQIASTSNPPPYSAALESDATVGAHRILVLAQEGLDIMAQVSVVVNDTLVSAEQWCERLGKRRPNEKDASETHGLSPVNESFPVDIEKPIVTESYLSDTPMGGMKGKV